MVIKKVFAAALLATVTACNAATGPLASQTVPIFTSSNATAQGSTVEVRIETGTQLKTQAAKKTSADIDHYHIKLVNTTTGAVVAEGDTTDLINYFHKMPNGTYKVIVDALDAAGNTIVQGGAQASSNTVTVASPNVTYSDGGSCLKVRLKLLNATGESVGSKIIVEDGDEWTGAPQIVAGGSCPCPTPTPTPTPAPTPTATPTPDPTNQWVTKAAMPTARGYVAAAAVGSKIYAIGGNDNDNTLNTVEEYDQTTNTWSTKSSLPTARAGLAAAEVNGKIYAIGGFDPNNTGGIFNTVEAYDPTTNTWLNKAPMPTARFGLAVTVVNGKIYAIGGADSFSTRTNKVEEYDPVTNTWSAKASMPTARFFLAAAEVNGTIYAIGGGNNTGYFNTVEAFNPATNVWSTKSPMPTARISLSAASASGKIYAVGGGTSSTPYLNTAEIYDPATNAWSTVAPMLTARSGLAVAAASNKLYAIGGANTAIPNVFLNTVEEYTP